MFHRHSHHQLNVGVIFLKFQWVSTPNEKKTKPSRVSCLSRCRRPSRVPAALWECLVWDASVLFLLHRREESPNCKGSRKKITKLSLQSQLPQRLTAHDNIVRPHNKSSFSSRLLTRHWKRQRVSHCCYRV